MSKSWIVTLIAMAWILSVGPFLVVGWRIDLGIPIIRMLTGGPFLGLVLATVAAFAIRRRERTPFEAAAWPFAVAAVFVDVSFLGYVFVKGF
jgi:hypothetical protein